MPGLPFSLVGALAGFTGVAAGAFAAHALKARLTAVDLAIFETAVRYQLIHALALLAVDALGWSGRGQAPAVQPWLRAAGWCFTAGIVVFSGSLYLLVATGVRKLGAVTPLGGLALLAGWAVLAVAMWRARQPDL